MKNKTQYYAHFPSVSPRLPVSQSLRLSAAPPSLRLRVSVSPSLSSKSGQALAEFVVGLIAVLTLAACLRIGASMITSHSDAMATARNEAASAASLGADVLSGAKYIHEVTEGSDKRQYTKDDRSTSANPSEFAGVVIGKTVEDDSEWDVLGQMPNSKFSKLRGGMNPSSTFGLVRGSDRRTVAIDQIPAVKFFYNAATMEVECNVWMTQINGMY
jgi:hypothetical protein